MDQVTAISMFVLWFALMLPAISQLLSRKPRLLKLAKYFIFGVYVLANLYETILFRAVKPEMTAAWEPLWSYRKSLSIVDGLRIDDLELFEEILLNILLYIPLGYLLPFTWCWFRSERLLSVRVILVGFVCSALTEITQLVFRIGLFEFDDMINNTLGCAVGCLLYGLIMRRHDRRSQV